MVFSASLLHSTPWNKNTQIHEKDEYMLETWLDFHRLDPSSFVFLVIPTIPFFYGLCLRRLLLVDLRIIFLRMCLLVGKKLGVPMNAYCLSCEADRVVSLLLCLCHPMQMSNGSV